ncbi:hypothetical protein DL766_010585 [Monosporascus sp. MC13-8B]|uniref:Histone chaperone domain-containing protein n=1 Tax=Monosporascus cannonballus TaxID=155416 RepID=A0ABY0GX82_9PEZI|nr:hypothetical protein DL762_008072 [Monosporascus cannonballus]RYO84691.1 hypothetical protein DL763_007376 [Monosporascus cannonballus]RYP01944.1 hypothetical protein DL766_010585 [Monosporascus sp. MC13-8B]
MSKVAYHQSDDKPSSTTGVRDDEVPEGHVQNDSYVMGADKKGEPAPVVGDDAKVEDPVDAKDPDSNRQLERDEKEAIDESNIVEGGREKPPSRSLGEPSDEDFGLVEGT